MNIKKNTLNITVSPVQDSVEKDGKRSKNACKRFLFLLLCVGSIGLSVLFSSCPRTINNPYNYNEDTSESQIPVFASPELQERMLFNEKRRKRAIMYNMSTCADLNDFDGDGVVNSEDPFPFDYKYPGIQIISDNFKLPLTLDSAVFGSDFSLKFRSTADEMDNPDNKIVSVGTLTVDRNIFNSSSIDSVFNYFNKYEDYFNYKEYDEDDSIYNSSTNTFNLNENNTVIEDWDLSSPGVIGDYKINLITLKGLEELSYTPDYYAAYPFGALTDFPKEAFSIFNRVNKELKDYQENNNDLSTTMCNLYELLTGKETNDPFSIGDLISWGREAFLTLESSEYIDELGLSDQNWSMFGYDTYAFSSFGIGNDFMDYRYPTNEGRWNLIDEEISCVEIDNIITRTIGVPYPDTECSFKFDTWNNKLNEMIALKVVVERDFIADFFGINSGTNSGESKLRFFISTPQSIQQKIDVGLITSKYLNILSNSSAGFRIESNKIVYDMQADQGLFPELVYEQLDESGGTRLNNEYMTFFFFLIPKEIMYYDNDINSFRTYTDWLFLGSTIHTWPARERSTVIAKLDQNDDVIEGPYVLPYDYVVNPGNFTAKYNGTLYETATNINLWDIFNIDANAGEKILFMSAMSWEEIYRPAPKVKTDEVFFIKSPIETSNIRYPLNVTQISLSNISVNSSNAVLLSIMEQLSYNAYKISIDNSIIGETLYGALSVRPDGLFTSHLDGEPEPNHLVMMNVSGLGINELSCDIDLSNSSHWIPNTNETPGNFKVNFSATLSNSENIILKNKEIILTSPTDPNFAVNDPGTCNINRNKGAGLVVYAVGEDDQLFHLANFDKNFPDGESASEAAPYHKSYNSTYFNIFSGLGANGYRLATDNDGNMAFYYGNSSTTNFTVKVLPGTAGIRPGDDFILNFSANSNGTLVTATAPEGDFFAVYDKNLLDWANQYIDETIDESGSPTGIADWNGENQISINPWRRFNDGNLVHNAIGYGWGCWDSVDMFNTEVNELNELSSDVFNWFNYSFPAFEIVTSNTIQYYSPTGALYSIPGLTTYAAFGDESQAMTVFKNASGVSLNPDGGILDTNNPGNKNYSWRLNSVGSGADCSGFVSRCSFLSGTNYKIVDINDDLTEEKEGTVTLNNSNYSWAISNNNLIVPGDIIIRSGYHVAFVLAVEFPDNSRDLGAGYLENVIIIHSTASQGKWRVRNDQYWDSLGEIYTLRRLVIE